VSDKGDVFVLDSYAVLAYLGGESGQKRVQEVLQQTIDGRSKAVLTLINLGEVAYIVERSQGLVRAQEALGLIEQLPVEILPADKDLVLAAAHIKANYPLAYADAFTVAAGLRTGGIILTGDPEFETVTDLVQVEMLSIEN
jgi:predicted nucleic acid-binding protein